MSGIIIQGIGFISTILFFLSFQCRSNRNLYSVQLLSYIFYALHFLLLNAWTGGASYMINMVRSLCLASNNRFLKSKTMCAILCTAQLAVLIITWAGPASILPVAANIAATLGGYTHNPLKVRIAGMFINSPLWIIYDIIVGSFAGILDEVISEASMIISVARFGWKALDKKED